jgi:hypothetical protein
MPKIIGDLAIPEDRAALEEAAMAAVENAREAWTALRMVREALEAKGPVASPEGLGFLDEAEVLVDAIGRLGDASTVH